MADKKIATAKNFVDVMKEMFKTPGSIAKQSGGKVNKKLEAIAKSFAGGKK